MTDNVSQLPTQEPLDPLVGPFTEYRVVVEGRVIPRLTGRHRGDHTILAIDHRFCIEVPKDLAYKVSWLIAQAMAVASGYPSFKATSKEQPFAPKAMLITDLEATP